MQDIKLLAIIVFITCSFTMQSQVEVKGVCGTVTYETDITRLKENIRNVADGGIDTRSGITRYVPVTFHFTADDNGNGFPREEQALEQLASLNELYAAQEFVLYIDAITYTEDSDLYDDHRNGSAQFKMRLLKDLNALNVYIVRTISNDGGIPGNILGYFEPSNDWIVMRRDEFNGTSGTLGHEIGHFFSLQHPHLGWGCQPYDEDTHGNPVSSVWSPCITSLRVELQNGSNCSSTGDFICDTPPDYNFGFGWSVGGDQCAEYDVGTMDPNGDVVDPMEVNIMAYFIDCAQYEFTNTQQNVVRSSYQSSGRSYIRTGVVPNTDPVEDDVLYNFPINDEESPTFSQIEFDWEDVSGANQYLFIVDRFPSFTSSPVRIITDESSLIMDELTSGARYFWKVWPFNESQTDAGWSETQSFIVGTTSAVNEIPSVEEFDVYPNPVKNGKLIVGIRSTESFEAEMRIMDMSGRVFHQSKGLQIDASTRWSEEVNTGDLARGMYIVQIISEKGILTSKFAVQ